MYIVSKVRRNESARLVYSSWNPVVIVEPETDEGSVPSKVQDFSNNRPPRLPLRNPSVRGAPGL